MLKLNSLTQSTCQVVRTVENPVPSGLALINCEVLCAEYPRQGPPLHWRAGLWNKPPLDIEIDAVNGRLLSVQTVLQDESIPRSNYCHPSSMQKAGIPCFSRDGWPSDDPFSDHRMEVFLAWNPRMELCVLVTKPPIIPALECQIDNTFAVLFNKDNQLVGFKLASFTDNEHELIRRAEVNRGSLE